MVHSDNRPEDSVLSKLLYYSQQKEALIFLINSTDNNLFLDNE